MFNTISNQVFYTLGLYDIWNMLDNQQKETLTEAINIGIDEGIKQVSVEPVVKPATCGTCKYFVSYRVDYEDELEPDDCGFCKHPKEGIDHTTIEDTCDLHEPSKLSV